MTSASGQHTHPNPAKDVPSDFPFQGVFRQNCYILLSTTGNSRKIHPCLGLKTVLAVRRTASGLVLFRHQSNCNYSCIKMREIVHLQAGQCGNQIGQKFWEVIIQFWEKMFKVWLMFNNLSGYKCRAWYLSRRRLWRRPWTAAWEDQCLLQRGQRWQVRAQGRVGGPGAWHHGQCQVWTLRADLQAGQLRVRTVWGW